MSRNGLNIAIFIVSLAGAATGYILENSVRFGLCAANSSTGFDTGCLNLYSSLGPALFYSFGALTIVFLVLLFIPKAFSAWWKFGIWAIPLAVLFMLLGSQPQHSWINTASSPDSVYRWVSGTFLIISLAIIGIAKANKK